MVHVLSSLTYPEAEALFTQGAVGLWPVGSTEAHGPHLPLATDVLIAEETCRRAGPALAARFGLETVILPALAFTVTDFAAPFSGTISIPRKTAIAYVRDVAVSASALGLRALCLVNAHLEPQHRFALRDAVSEARLSARCPIGLADPAERRFAPTLTEEFQKSAHAGRYETSLVLAHDPAQVRVHVQAGLEPREVDLVHAMKAGAKNFLEVGATAAYLGDPRAATPTEGDDTYARLVEMVEAVVGDLLIDQRAP